MVVVYPPNDGLWKARRYVRRELRAPRMVETIWTGPPWLDLDRRKLLLESLRHHLERCGLRLEAVRGGWRYRVIAQEEQALALLEADEAAADADGQWWGHDVVWRSDDDITTVLYGHDPDGNDITFQGWGPGAPGCLAGLKAVLEAHHP